MRVGEFIGRATQIVIGGSLTVAAIWMAWHAMAFYNAAPPSVPGKAASYEILAAVCLGLASIVVGLFGITLFLVPFVPSSLWARLVRPPISGERDAPDEYAGTIMWLWWWYRFWRNR